MEGQKGPFFDWGVRAGGIAARAVSCSLCRQQLIEKVRGLRREGKHDEVEAMKSEFNANRDQWHTILDDAKKFQSEFGEKFPDRDDQNKFVGGMRREAIGNKFVVRHGTDTINVASQIMWVVAPWDKDTQGVLQLRQQTGCNITDTHPQALKRLIKAGQDELNKLAKELPTLEDMATGKADFGAQTVNEEMDEITANIGCVQRVLARVEGAAARKQDEKRMQEGAKDDGSNGGDEPEREETDPAVKKLEKLIESKTKAMQVAAGRTDFEGATKLRDEIKTLTEQLEAEKRKLRESGATAMAGATPVETPVVKLQQIMVVDEESGETVEVGALAAKYQKQLAELTEAADGEEGHEATAKRLDVEGDNLIAAGNRSEAGKKFMLAETSRALAKKCRTDAEKLTEKITQLQSHEAEKRSRMAEAAKDAVKAAAKKELAETPATPAAEDPIAMLEAFVEDADGAEIVGAVADLLEAAKVAQEKGKGAKQIRKAVDAAKSGDFEAIKAKTAALVALAR